MPLARIPGVKAATHDRSGKLGIALLQAATEPEPSRISIFPREAQGVKPTKFFPDGGIFGVSLSGAQITMSNKSKNFFVNTLVVGQLICASSLACTQANGADDRSAKPHIDLAFCIDTTGSMQNEIDNVKTKTKEIVARLAGGKPSPSIRVGLVAFRDRGDEYVTKTFQFSDDIDQVVKDISSLKANGGGDGPEAVNQALHSAVNDLKWDTDKKTLKMLFLIGDASPHKYAGDYDWRTESKAAISRGIQINTLGCEGLQSYPENEGIGVFKEIARLADGKFESLAYRQEVVNATGARETVISSAGKLYRVKAKGSDAWKAGAEALSSKGEADEMVAPPPAIGASAPSASFAMRGFAGAARLRAPSEAKFAEMGAGASVSRKDSNLADVVLEATRSAAAKKLNVDFKGK